MLIPHFTIGMKVRMTQKGIEQRLDGRKQRRTGTVVSIPKENSVRVLRDGLKQPETWHYSFWESIF